MDCFKTDFKSLIERWVQIVRNNSCLVVGATLIFFVSNFALTSIIMSNHKWIGIAIFVS
jgi:hypothetical protein